jgi:GxxExxY protein
MSKRPLERSCVDPEKRIEAAAHEVFRELGGAGYNEHVYQHSLRMELEMNGYMAECEVPVPIVYKGKHVGLGKIDLLVDGEIVVEVKAVQKLTPAMEAQLNAYLRARSAKLGVLVNFGVVVECRFVKLE